MVCAVCEHLAYRSGIFRQLESLTNLDGQRCLDDAATEALTYALFCMCVHRLRRHQSAQVLSTICCPRAVPQCARRASCYANSGDPSVRALGSQQFLGRCPPQAGVGGTAAEPGRGFSAEGLQEAGRQCAGAVRSLQRVRQRQGSGALLTEGEQVDSQHLSVFVMASNQQRASVASMLSVSQ